MAKHLIKIENPQHCALSVAHAGLDNQYCESGEVVAIDWQPSSGWGLEEAHYTDEDGNVVSIDLSIREFTMPAKAITVSGTAKRFVASDWKGNFEVPAGEEYAVVTSDGIGGMQTVDDFKVEENSDFSTKGNGVVGRTLQVKGQLTVGEKGRAEGIVLYDTAVPTQAYLLTIRAGEIQVDALS